MMDRSKHHMEGVSWVKEKAAFRERISWRLLKIHPASFFSPRGEREWKESCFLHSA
jgi:hypothetical protein